jgi:hypothetical protein
VQLTVLQQVTALRRAPLPHLRERWKALFGRDAPASYRPEQLVRRLAWRVQEIHYGGLSPKAQATLRRIAAEDDLACGRRRAPQRRAGALVPGTRLVRSWGGADHVVTATADGGFEYAGKRYRTLTAVAKAITGQHLSGPRFFGLAASKETMA